jgi:hypothetical protein
MPDNATNTIKIKTNHCEKILNTCYHENKKDTQNVKWRNTQNVKWRRPALIRLPLECESSALPFELHPLNPSMIFDFFILLIISYFQNDFYYPF